MTLSPNHSLHKLLGMFTMPHLTSSGPSRREEVSCRSSIVDAIYEYEISSDINCLCLGKQTAILASLPSFPIIVTPKNLLETEAAPYNVCYHYYSRRSLIFVVALMEEQTLTARKAVDKKWPTSCSAGELSLGSPKVAAFPCGWGIWLSASSKSPTWNSLCISLEGSQTIL